VIALGVAAVTWGVILVARNAPDAKRAATSVAPIAA
jgi:hypothetical protein